MIDVSHYLLNEHHTKDIPNELLNGKKSTSINLSAKNLKSIPRNISLFKDLKYLDFSINYLTDVCALPDSLKYVILNFNKLFKLPKHFFELKNIEIIQLNTIIYQIFNKIESLPCTISKLINLKYINISGNKLADFPYRCKDLINLKELDLCNNYIVNIEPICEINNLEYLHLRNNKITEITNNIGNLKNLICLNLSGNNISNLPKEIIKCEKLKELCLSLNQITNFDLICGIKAIMFLYIDNNQISGIPDNIGNLENLEELVLSSNNISFLPKSLINCKNLLKLDLRDNKIIYISNELLEMLITLRYLNLKGNDF
ncbi:leucine-rich repeat-containing protein 1 [Vairimorpha apis BRL 01]|uniref:Leucine-rich repeat-containing protein 1 n=1 Tax=Vairimorpha apis BRL 01 TaxID=1037528 RepID=T0L753_9MICR|nr:leucine-rich repeat-containing protein 1 [Vairimorpha apis BRL 01]